MITIHLQANMKYHKTKIIAPTLILNSYLVYEIYL